MMIEVSVSVGGVEYSATMEEDRVSIYQSGVHAGDGRWFLGIEDCDADLGEAVYTALDEAIEAQLATNVRVAEHAIDLAMFDTGCPMTMTPARHGAEKRQRAQELVASIPVDEQAKPVTVDQCTFFASIDNRLMCVSPYGVYAEADPGGELPVDGPGNGADVRVFQRVGSGVSGGAWGERRDVYAVAVDASGHGSLVVWRVQEMVCIAHESGAGSRHIKYAWVEDARRAASRAAAAVVEGGWQALDEWYAGE